MLRRVPYSLNRLVAGAMLRFCVVSLLPRVVR